MSIDLDWSLLARELSGRLCEHINGVLASAELPEFVGAISLRSLDLGADPPHVRVARVGDVWPEFREAALAAGGGAGGAGGGGVPAGLRPPRMPPEWDARSASEADESIASSWSLPSDDFARGVPPAPAPAPAPASLTALPDVQLHLAVHWPTTQVRAALTGALQLHYADARILSLPLSLTLTGLEFVAEVVVAVDPELRAIFLTLVEDEGAGTVLEHPRLWQPRRRSSRASRILPYLAFDSRVGEPEKHVLENVGKVEKFAGDVARQVLESELVYPNFYTLQLE